MCFTEDFNWMHRTLLGLGMGQQETNAPVREFVSTSPSEAQCRPRAFSFPNTGLIQDDSIWQAQVYSH